MLSSIYWVSFPLVFNLATSLYDSMVSMVTIHLLCIREDTNYFIKGLNTFKFVCVANERECFETQLVGAPGL